MQYEFPYLLSEDNMENMMIVKDGDRVVSIASFLKRDILVEGHPIKTASIGAVCTYEEYRGKQLSSKALDSVEEKMKKDGVMLSLVSGTRTLYTRRNYVELNSMTRYEYKSDELSDIIESGENIGYKITEYSEDNEEHIQAISRLYNQKSNRFIRDLEEFKTIIKSRPFTWGELDYRTVVIEKDSKIEAYLILQTISQKNGVVVEVGGNNTAIEYGVAYLTKELNLEKTVYDIPENEVSSRLEKCPEENIANGGTVKIINYVELMEALRPYFSQYYIDSEELEFSEMNSGQESSEIDNSKTVYRIKIDDEVLDIEGVGNITNLIFGDPREVLESLKDKPEIEKLVSRALPVPIPYTENLNYQ